MNRLALLGISLTLSTLACSDIRVPSEDSDGSIDSLDADIEECPIGVVCGVDKVNYAFVTSQTVVPGSLEGLDGADDKCQELADGNDSMVPPGEYIAWLSDSNDPVADRLDSASGWLRLDGRPFALSALDLLSGNILYPLNIQDNGITITKAMDGVVLTGTGASGFARGGDCAGWKMSVTGDNPQLGFALTDGLAWTEAPISTGFKVTCDLPVRLYCLGIDHETPLMMPKLPDETRFAWVSEATFKGDETVEVMDSACQLQASSGENQFEAKAFVATNGMSAAGEFDTDGPTWARPDGVVLWAQASDMRTVPPLSPIGRLLDGQPTDAPRVWTGALSPGTSPNLMDNCNDWTDGEPTVKARVGLPNQTGEFYFAAMKREACAKDFSVYCLETLPK